MLYAVLFCFGLAAGSFLNVVIFRYRPGQKLFDFRIIGGRSRCLFCQKKLVWHELIPVISFLSQRGRCRHCGERFSFQYPVVELLGGLIFILPAYFYRYYGIANYFLSGQSFVWYYLFSIIWILAVLALLLLAVIDLRLSVIPDQINLFLAFLGLIFVVVGDYFNKFDYSTGSFLKHYASIFGLRTNIWINHLFAAVLGIVIFGIIILISRGKAMGMGDLKLAAALGFLFGWPDALLIFILAFIIGSILGIFLLATGRKTLKDGIPFGPFLALGAVSAMFFGYQIIDMYFKFFNI